jgi:hypothetical protein
MLERTSDETEALLQEGCRRLIREKRNGIKINIAQTARDLDVVYGTLRTSYRSCLTFYIVVYTSIQ